MRIKTRLERLEQKAGGPIQWEYLRQDLDNPDLFTGRNGRQYRIGACDWPENCICIIYESDWRDVPASFILPDNGRDKGGLLVT